MAVARPPPSEPSRQLDLDRMRCLVARLTIHAPRARGHRLRPSSGNVACAIDADAERPGLQPLTRRPHIAQFAQITFTFGVAQAADQTLVGHVDGVLRHLMLRPGG